MANKKFSEFELKTSTSNVSHIVGYNGTENVRITPSDVLGAYLPLAGGTLTGALTGTSATFTGSINAGVSTFNSDGGGTALKIIARLAGETSVLRFYANDGTTQNAWIGSSNSNFDINSVANYPLTFRTNDTLALTIDTSQNSTFAGDVTLSAAGSTGEIIRTTDNTEPYFAFQRNSGVNGVAVLNLEDGGHLAFDTGATGASQSELNPKCDNIPSCSWFVFCSSHFFAMNC